MYGSRTKERLTEIYRRLEAAFGDPGWWPGESPFEIAVGAVLTQNTSWRNVEKAIGRLKDAELLSPEALRNVTAEELAGYIVSAGYYNVKARRLKSLMEFLWAECGGRVEALADMPVAEARGKLLSVNGVGPETADSILLYAAGIPTFAVDAYTHRILGRHGLAQEEAGYDEVKAVFEDNLEPDTVMFNKFHALLVKCGHLYCKPKPKCEGCPLEGLLPT
ncbi:MAG: endonuclease III domain-containing protein [Candidatus Coatesbacteria bacterium]|nr:MAG: endonuclease III domain-containing protein [Candidatus Coatesbacteria bacterium]